MMPGLPEMAQKWLKNGKTGREPFSGDFSHFSAIFSPIQSNPVDFGVDFWSFLLFSTVFGQFWSKKKRPKSTPLEGIALGAWRSGGGGLWLEVAQRGTHRLWGLRSAFRNSISPFTCDCPDVFLLNVMAYVGRAHSQCHYKQDHAQLEHSLHMVHAIAPLTFTESPYSRYFWRRSDLERSGPFARYAGCKDSASSMGRSSGEPPAIQKDR